MKKIYLILLSSIILASSCQKSISDFDPSMAPSGNPGGTQPGNGSGSFEATIDGTKISFSITAATLLRSTSLNEKRMDITGTSTDGTKRLIVTLGEETAQGNAMTVKTYTLNAFPLDDPATPNIDESATTQGFTTYGTTLGNNSWLYDIYDENGSFSITSCDASSRLVSGTFQTTLTDMIDNTHIVTITAGKLTNVKYSVLN
jgi:hypothetical protein